MDDPAKIKELRAKFAKKYTDPPTERSSKFDPRDVTRFTNDDVYALSFIHWKKEVIDDAVEMVADVLQWRKENGVTDLSVESIGHEFFERGIIHIHGRDVDGGRVMALISQLIGKNEKEQVRKLFTFWLERLQRSEPGKHVTFILDTRQASMSSMDMGFVRYIIDAFTTYFPDLLQRIIILDLPFLMNAVCNVIMKMMSEEQRSATIFCSRKDLHKYVAPDQLPESLGGTDPWAYSFPPFPDDLKQIHHFKDDPLNFALEADEKTTDQKETTTSDSNENKSGGAKKKEKQEIDQQMESLKLEA